MNCITLSEKVAEVLKSNEVEAELQLDSNDNIYFTISKLSEKQLKKLKQDLENLGNKVYSFTQFDTKTKTIHGRIKVKNQN